MFNISVLLLRNLTSFFGSSFRRSLLCFFSRLSLFNFQSPFTLAPHSRGQLIQYITFFSVCQVLFKTFFNFSFRHSCVSLYFVVSVFVLAVIYFGAVLSDSLYILPLLAQNVKRFFNIFLKKSRFWAAVANRQRIRSVFVQFLQQSYYSPTVSKYTKSVCFRTRSYITV